MYGLRHSKLTPSLRSTFTIFSLFTIKQMRSMTCLVSSFQRVVVLLTLLAYCCRCRNSIPSIIHIQQPKPTPADYLHLHQRCLWLLSSLVSVCLCLALGVWGRVRTTTGLPQPLLLLPGFYIQLCLSSVEEQVLNGQAKNKSKVVDNVGRSSCKLINSGGCLKITMAVYT